VTSGLKSILAAESRVWGLVVAVLVVLGQWLWGLQTSCTRELAWRLQPALKARLLRETVTSAERQGEASHLPTDAARAAQAVAAGFWGVLELLRGATQLATIAVITALHLFLGAHGPGAYPPLTIGVPAVSIPAFAWCASQLHPRLSALRVAFPGLSMPAWQLRLQAWQLMPIAAVVLWVLGTVGAGAVSRSRGEGDGEGEGGPRRLYLERVLLGQAGPGLAFEARYRGMTPWILQAYEAEVARGGQRPPSLIAASATRLWRLVGTLVALALAGSYGAGALWALEARNRGALALPDMVAAAGAISAAYTAVATARRAKGALAWARLRGESQGTGFAAFGHGC
jgi:hypothetical protein